VHAGIGRDADGRDPTPAEMETRLSLDSAVTRILPAMSVVTPESI